MSNPEFFFKSKIFANPVNARYWADICDDVYAKGPATDSDAWKLALDMVQERAYTGEADAWGLLRAAMRHAAGNMPREWAAYDEDRSATFETEEAKEGGAGDGEPDQPDPTSDGGRTGPASGGGKVTGPQQPPVKIGGKCGGVVQVKGPGRIELGTGSQGTLFTITYASFRSSLPHKLKAAKSESHRRHEQKYKTDRLCAEQDGLVKHIESFIQAADVIQDLANVHRLENSVSGVLRAAGKTAADVGLTQEAVNWADGQMRAA
ncbi:MULTISPECIES: hypothetical protein [unclassified Streptomyces]|uniref:hypothetical protein n=1 Tax=unclassified Streptomyces TaxID=2593676 RepID=UPI0004CC791E|nr:hypothetical protein [Streptomyces sp. NRRL F-2747]